MKPKEKKNILRDSEEFKQREPKSTNKSNVKEDNCLFLSSFSGFFGAPP